MNFTMFRSVRTLIREKIWCITKIGKRARRRFCVDYGDIPACTYNEITDKWEPVVNPRGNAYASRKKLKYRVRKPRKTYGDDDAI